jgi:hypothetical protein
VDGFPLRPGVVLLTAVLLAACGAADGGSVGGPGEAVPVEEALAAPEGERLRVRGVLFTDGAGPWRLCAALAESFPPQCGGPAADLVGYDPATFPPGGGTAGPVRWLESYEAIVHRDGDTLVVEQ